MRKIMLTLSMLAFAASAGADGFCYNETVTALMHWDAN
jgi:hypothetical protein